MFSCSNKLGPAASSCGHRGYSPEHLCELSFEQRYDDGEADAGGHQVQQGGLNTDARD